MRGALVIAVLLLASPALAKDVACLPDTKAADEAASNAGEDLIWEGRTSSGVEMRFYLGKETWTVFFQRSDSLWCTSPTMVGTILKVDSV
jgi:hypothetical protein